MLQLSDNELKEEMYRSIKQVTVYASKELEIHWKLDDFFQPFNVNEEGKVG